MSILRWRIAKFSGRWTCRLRICAAAASVSPKGLTSRDCINASKPFSASVERVQPAAPAPVAGVSDQLSLQQPVTRHPDSFGHIRRPWSVDMAVALAVAEVENEAYE